MGWFNKILGNEQKVSFEFNAVQCDMHSHLIPGIDDGSRSMDQTLEMLEYFVQLGYSKVITTPHIKSGVFDNDASIINEGKTKVQKAIQDAGIPIVFEAAAEYFFDYSFLEKIEANDLLSFGQNYVLVEFAFGQPPMGENDMFFQLQLKGYQPIMAHFERYPYYHGSVEKALDLRSRGVKIQLNHGSIIGHYGPQVQKQAEKLLRAGVVDCLGSDCHRIEHLQLMDANRNHPLLQLIDVEQLLNRRM